MSRQLLAVAEVRVGGWSYRAERVNRGGEVYFRYNTRWIRRPATELPAPVLRALTAALDADQELGPLL